MNRYERMKIELLRGAKAAREYLPIRIHELAYQYAIEQQHVREKLVDLHTQQLIRLSAWDEKDHCDKPFGEWPDADYFFSYASDGNYKRIRLLFRGAEFLENLTNFEEQPSGSKHVSHIDAERKFVRSAIDEAQKSAPESDGRRPPTLSEKSDWKSFTPDPLLDAVTHIRERFEEEEFKFNFATQQKCYKELHPVAAMEIAPAVFKYYMDVFEEGLKQAVTRGFDDLFEIGLANATLLSQGPIEWAKSHLGLLITGKEYKIEHWIKSVCDQQEMSKSTTPEDMEEFIHWRTWRAPVLIIMQPSGSRPYDPATVWSRATEEQTEKFLHGLSKRFVQGLDFHLERVAGEAYVKLAKQGRQIRRPSTEEPSTKRVADDNSDANTPVAFVSYSWDSDVHKEWVLDLATRLQKEGGVRIILDRWHLAPGGDKTVFMEKSIGNSKFVILICTPNYAQRANNREGGVGYEATIITAELAENINQRKFIPVLRNGDWQSSLPVWIKNKVGVDLRNDPYSDEQYQELLRAIHNEPIKPPPIGPKPMFAIEDLHTSNAQQDKGGVAVTETSKDEYRAVPTTFEIDESIRAVSLYLKESVASSYAGLKVRWQMQLYNIRPLSDGRIDVSLRNGDTGPLVVLIVDLADYPILKTVRGGEPVEVVGTIDYVQTNAMVHLKDAKLKFLS